jgi:uncharacterized protein YneF (UPF0154 family)
MKLNLSHNKGEITSKDLLITGIVVLVLAGIIVGIFIILNSKKQQESQTEKTQEYILEIKKQAARKQQTEAIDKDKEGAQAEPGIERSTFTGVLTDISQDSITIQNKSTNQTTVIALLQESSILYNGESFDKEDFFVGDQLTIVAEKNKSLWEAISIVVLFSASPETAAPVPQQLETRPDGTVKPLGNS